MAYKSRNTLKMSSSSEVTSFTVYIFNVINILCVYKSYLFSTVFVAAYALWLILFLTEILINLKLVLLLNYPKG